MAAEKKSFLLRIDPLLWVALEKLAAVELRSVNGQIEYLLRDAAARRGLLGSRDVEGSTGTGAVVSGGEPG